MSTDKSKKSVKEAGRSQASGGVKPPSNAAMKKIQDKEQAKRDSRNDKYKVLFAVAILLAGFGVYYNVPGLNEFVRGAVAAAAAAAAVAVCLFWCSFGRRLLRYIRDSYGELRKVVAPDRKTTTQMTIYVIVFVSILAGYMWFSDWLSNWFLYSVVFRVL